MRIVPLVLLFAVGMAVFSGCVTLQGPPGVYQALDQNTTYTAKDGHVAVVFRQYQAWPGFGGVDVEGSSRLGAVVAKVCGPGAAGAAGAAVPAVVTKTFDRNEVSGTDVVLYQFDVNCAQAR